MAAARARPVDAKTRDGAVREARRRLQDRTTRDYAWFAAAFDHPDKWSFAVAVVDGSLPRRLLRPILDAAIRHPNVSSNQCFVRAAVKSFPVDEVRTILEQRLAEMPDKWERDKVRAAMYWLGPAASDKRQAELHRRFKKLPAEQRIRELMRCDADARRVLVRLLPYNRPAYRALLAEAAAFARTEGDVYVLSVFREKGVISDP
jgi:hypothetical protein